MNFGTRDSRTRETMIHFKIFRNSHVSDEGLLSRTEFQAGSAPALRASLAHGSRMEEPTTASLKHASIHHQYANINSSLISFAIRDEVQVCAYVRGVFPPGTPPHPLSMRPLY